MSSRNNSGKLLRMDREPISTKFTGSFTIFVLLLEFIYILKFQENIVESTLLLKLNRVHRPSISLISSYIYIHNINVTYNKFQREIVKFLNILFNFLNKVCEPWIKNVPIKITNLISSSVRSESPSWKKARNRQRYEEGTGRNQRLLG